MERSFLLTILIIIFIPITLFSQIKITGKIVNQKEEVLELIEVLILNKDSLAIKSELTNVNGEFSLSVEKGEYLLQVRQMGTILWRQKIKTNQNLDLGIIKVTEKEQKLIEVVVISRKKLIERKVDRLVFNVENSIASAGGDAIDALKVTPGIRVQNDAISMIGKSGMAVMVDDRLIQLSGDDLVAFLKTIQSDNIKSIEVITTPPAKYDAEGNSGLVNIKLKKGKSDTWGASLNGVYNQSSYPTGTLGGNFNFQKDKVSLVINSNYSNEANQGVEKSKIFYPTETWDSEGIGKYFKNMLSNRFGIDYQFTKKWSMGAQYIGSHNKPNIIDENTTYLTDNMTNVNNGIIQTFGNNIRKKDVNSLNWHTNIVLDTLGRNISVDFDYLNFISNNNRDFYSTTSNSNETQIPNGYSSAKNVSDQKVDNYSAQINMDYPLKWVNFSYGAKLSFSKTNNGVSYFDTTNGIPMYDPSQSDLFEYNENTEALYVSGNKKFGKNKWEIQIGLRMESTQTVGNSISYNQITKYDYTNFFPTTYLSYAPIENHNFSLNYSKRISRPGFNELNPFKWYSTPYSYSEGNPYLRPTYTNNLEFNYSYKDYLYTTVYYSKSVDNSGQVVLLNGNDYTQKITRLNYFDGFTTGIQQVCVFKKVKWIESQNSLSVYFQHSDSKIDPITPKTTEGFGASIMTSNTFTLNKEKTILSGFDLQYNSPHKSNDLVYNYSSTRLNVYVRMFFLNKNLQLSLVGNNLLKAYDFNNTSNRNNIEARYSGYYDSRYFRLSLTYKFGNSKINVNQRKISNEDEKGRAK